MLPDPSVEQNLPGPDGSQGGIGSLRRAAEGAPPDALPGAGACGPRSSSGVHDPRVVELAEGVVVPSEHHDPTPGLAEGVVEARHGHRMPFPVVVFPLVAPELLPGHSE